MGVALGQVSADAKEQSSQNELSPEPTDQKPDINPPVKTDGVAAEIAPTNPASKDHNRQTAADHVGELQSPLGKGEPLVSWADTFAQWVMAITSIGALIISCWAVCLLKNTLIATRHAVREARDATKAAQDAVKVTENAANQQLRAYVHCAGAYFFNFTNEIVYLQIKTENYGQTPAYDVHLTYSLSYRAIGSEPEPLDESIWRPLGVLAPQSFVGTVIEIDNPKLPDENKQSLLDRIAVFYVVGAIKYIDVFNIPRRTDFKLMLGGDSVIDDKYHFGLCEDGNTAT